MAKEIKLDLKINDGDAAQSIGDIKTRLRELRNAMIQAGEGSAEFERLAMEAANLKEQMNAANDAVRNFTPDSLEAVGNFAGKAAAGVQLVTGAMNLFGEQSEETEKALLKVQSAMAFAQGIQGVKDFGLALKGLFAVISANPVGALATLIAGLALEVGMLYKSYQDANSEVAKATRLAEEQKKITADLSREYDRQIALLEAQGASEEEIIAIKKEKMNAMLLEAEMSARASLARIKEIQENDSLYESYLRVTEGILRKVGEDEKADLLAAKIQMSKNERAAEDKANFDEQIQQIKDLRNELQILDIQVEKSQQNAANAKTKAAEDTKIVFEQLDSIVAMVPERVGSAAQLIEQVATMPLENIEKRMKTFNERLLGFQTKLYMAAYQSQKRFSDDTAKATSDLFGAMADLSKKNAKAQKAFSVAQAIINTYQGVTKALATLPPPASYVAAAATLASGLASVRNILSVNEDNPSATGGGAMSGGMGSLEFSSQPNINANQQPSTLLNEQGQVINQQAQQPPMYVAVSEIRQTQQAVEAVELRSRF